MSPIRPEQELSRASEGAKFGYHSNKDRVNCGAAVYLLDEQQTSVVFIERKGAHGAGTWSVPGGWQHPREDPERTAVREVWEEVGVEINSLDFLGYSHTVFGETRDGRNIESTTLWFATVDWSGTPRNTNPDRIETVEMLPWEVIVDWYNLANGLLFKGFRDAYDKGIIPDIFVVG